MTMKLSEIESKTISSITIIKGYWEEIIFD